MKISLVSLYLHPNIAYGISSSRIVYPHNRYHITILYLLILYSIFIVYPHNKYHNIVLCILILNNILSCYVSWFPLPSPRKRHPLGIFPETSQNQNPFSSDYLITLFVIFYRTQELPIQGKGRLKGIKVSILPPNAIRQNT